MLWEIQSSDDASPKSSRSSKKRMTKLQRIEFDALLNQLHGSGAPGINE